MNLAHKRLIFVTIPQKFVTKFQAKLKVQAKLKGDKFLWNAKQRFFCQHHWKRPATCQTMTYLPNSIFSWQTTLKKAKFLEFGIKLKNAKLATLVLVWSNPSYAGKGDLWRNNRQCRSKYWCWVLRKTFQKEHLQLSVDCNYLTRCIFAFTSSASSIDAYGFAARRLSTTSYSASNSKQTMINQQRNDFQISPWQINCGCSLVEELEL